MDKHIELLHNLLIYYYEQRQISVMVFNLREEINYETIKLLLKYNG
jgi:hypothetical protein